MMAWAGVIAMWGFGVAMFVGFCSAILWISGRVLPLSNRGRRRD